MTYEGCSKNNRMMSLQINEQVCFEKDKMLANDSGANREFDQRL